MAIVWSKCPNSWHDRKLVKLMKKDNWLLHLENLFCLMKPPWIIIELFLYKIVLLSTEKKKIHAIENNISFLKVVSFKKRIGTGQFDDKIAIVLCSLYRSNFPCSVGCYCSSAKRVSSQVKHAISPSWKKHAAAAQLYCTTKYNYSPISYYNAAPSLA